MRIEIDQSGKIEYTSMDTVIAFSNSKSKSVLIVKKEKREIQKFYREHKQSRIFIYKTFACLIYLIIKDDLQQIKEIIIDQEYKGHEAEIKHYLLQIIYKTKKDFHRDNITFKQIGKKSPAHILAYKTYIKSNQANIVVKADELIKYLIKLKN